jgi:hypothetical protein
MLSFLCCRNLYKNKKKEEVTNFNKVNTNQSLNMRGVFTPRIDIVVNNSLDDSSTDDTYEVSDNNEDIINVNTDDME